MSKLAKPSMTVGGHEVKINLPKIPLVDLPDSAVKLCSYQDIQHLEGKLKTYIDSLITGERQNKAVKDIMADIARELWTWLDFSCDGTTYKMVAYLRRLSEQQ